VHHRYAGDGEGGGSEKVQLSLIFLQMEIPVRQSTLPHALASRGGIRSLDSYDG